MVSCKIIKFNTINNFKTNDKLSTFQIIKVKKKIKKEMCKKHKIHVYKQEKLRIIREKKLKKIDF